MSNIYISYLIFLGIAFAMYSFLDLLFFRFLFIRIMRNLFQSVLLSFSWILMDKNTSLGIACLLALLVFGDYFYYHYVAFKKPSKSKEPTNGPIQ